MVIIQDLTRICAGPPFRVLLRQTRALIMYERRLAAQFDCKLMALLLDKNEVVCIQCFILLWTTPTFLMARYWLLDYLEDWVILFHCQWNSILGKGYLSLFVSGNKHVSDTVTMRNCLVHQVYCCGILSSYSSNVVKILSLLRLCELVVSSVI